MTVFPNTLSTRLYYAVIARRGNPETENSEVHHIIPESFYINRSRPGPAGWLIGDSEAAENKVRLSAYDHFICHWLLKRMTSGAARDKMVYGLNMMVPSDDNQQRKITPLMARIYERNRIEFAKVHSERMTGDDNPAKRPEMRELMRQLKTGVSRAPFSQEWLDKMSAAKVGSNNNMYGKNHRDSTKQILREQKLGKPQTPEHIQSRADAVRGSKRAKLLCPHCLRDIPVNTYPRFHGDKCKMKTKSLIT
jgi:hypothetical protein